MKKNYKSGYRILQTAKQEIIGFEQDCKIVQLVEEISDFLKQIDEDNVAAQRIESDASHVLKSVQQKERKKTMFIAIAILMALIVMLTLILYSCEI